MKTVLDRIWAAKRNEVEAAKSAIPLDDLKGRCKDCSATRGFRQAIASDPRDIALVAEVKKASPVKGIIRENFDALAIARSYDDAGATAISVLTDTEFFQGHPAYLTKIRATCERPLLRKDFIVDAYQVFESRAIGADAILLIVNGLEPSELRDFRALALELGMDVLVEAHSQAEVDIAHSIGADMIGINNRDLETFETRLDIAERLIPELPNECVAVAESALSEREDVERMIAAGARAVLIGSAFCKQTDVAAAVRDIMPW
ncbi:MAG: Indole-3-glycerol phosphate synthase [Fimbriimonadaceae bacterium]|nr:Indole-3-glycerol phosphate synthase [Fimbriimonadaceae bacterium]